MADEPVEVDEDADDEVEFAPDPLIIPTGSLGKYRNKWMNERFDPDNPAVQAKRGQPYDPTKLTWSTVLVLATAVLATVGTVLVGPQMVPGVAGWVGGVVAALVVGFLWLMFASPWGARGNGTRRLVVSLCLYALGIAGWLYAGLPVVAGVIAAGIALGEGNERRRELMAKVLR